MWFVILRTFFLLLKLVTIGAHYNKAFVDDLCNSDGVWNLGSGNSNSSGVLRTSKEHVFLKNKNCTIIIQPPLGYGVILSVRLLDFRPYYSPDCQNFIEVSGVQLCGYSDDLTEFQSYFTDGKPMKLKFLTTNESGSEYRSDVFFVATSFVKFSYSCEQKMFECTNSRCIWKGLTCDGHNNCGDESDEFSHGNANCGMMSPGIIAAIVVGSVMTFIILIIIPFACCRRRRRRNSLLIQPDDTREEQPEHTQDLPPAYKP
ncbi:uncharacterized protein [Parasteatoda tepidariorum]|uniref:uncharacterized protein n=1 Tax=Parasteatoda tepidariorum TaxID=114398 RepID=UPI001C725F9D|nr:uncharacterized protein LOC107453381 [Parasteatoda tepidariorum]